MDDDGGDNTFANDIQAESNAAKSLSCHGCSGETGLSLVGILKAARYAAG